MKVLTGLLLFLAFIRIPVKGQNLCTNGDFDTYTTLPNNYAQVCYANGWTSPSGICALVVGTGSPDYYNTGGSGGSKPPATWWATVSPHSGTGMEGFAAWYSGNYREYISRQLSSALSIGQVYTVSFWYTNGVSTLHGYGCNNLGIAFSSIPLTQTGGNPIAYVPQLESSAILYSTTWQKLSFLYTPSTADQYITIGNFRSNAATSISLFGTGTTGAYYYIDDVSVTAGNSLPVELISFTADLLDNGGVSVQWTTASEINNDYFKIQRGKNGDDFQEIGSVEGAGNSTVLNQYSFQDIHPGNGITYYRLLQTDFDGKENYCRTIALKIHPLPGVNWTYRPSTQTIQLLFNDQVGQHPNIYVYNLAGQCVYQSENSQQEELIIPTGDFPDGLYALDVEAENFHSTNKIPVFH